MSSERATVIELLGVGLVDGKTVAELGELDLVQLAVEHGEWTEICASLIAGGRSPSAFDVTVEQRVRRFARELRLVAASNYGPPGHERGAWQGAQS